MLQSLLDLLAREISPQQCLENVQTIARYHRIQASPGYRAAAVECQRILTGGGTAATITTYPATGRNRQWQNLTPQEWDCRDAELWLLDAQGKRIERLAWYQAMNLSIIQRSASTAPEGVTAELTVVDNAEDAAAWAGRDVVGKVVLVGNGDIHRIWQHAHRAGAAGLVTARMTYHPPVRPVGDLADALQYTSFWWSEGEPKGWGFVLSTRQGDRLKQLLAAGKVAVWARVDAQAYDGAMENVEAVIPGTTDQEVLVVAHLCHPKPSANDNASGPATVMETARALTRLIAAGQLAKPRRTIRFLLVPEMTGTYAYLAALSDAQRSRIVAAVNADMVGEKQEVTGSTLLCEYPPLACPSFAGDLLSLILSEVAKEEPALSGLGTRYGTFRYATVPFSGGSDHYILADLTVGIPCPMVIQWPDRFYHTSADTVDRVDPAMMARVGRMIVAYAYFLATGGAKEVAWLASEMTQLFNGQLHATVHAGPGLEATAQFRLERKLADLESLDRLLTEAEWQEVNPTLAVCRRQLAETVSMELERTLLGRPAVKSAPRSETPANTAVTGWSGSADLSTLHPRRNLPGPVTLRNDLNRLPESEAESWRRFDATHPGAARMADYLCYWADGERSLTEICRLTELETGIRDDSWALGYCQLLQRLGMATL
ncbi:MAG: DUF4910 domain-containing protein [Mycobacterium leprae]